MLSVANKCGGSYYPIIAPKCLAHLKLTWDHFVQVSTRDHIDRIPNFTRVTH